MSPPPSSSFFNSVGTARYYRGPADDGGAAPRRRVFSWPSSGQVGRARQRARQRTRQQCCLPIGVAPYTHILSLSTRVRHARPVEREPESEPFKLRQLSSAPLSLSLPLPKGRCHSDSQEQNNAHGRQHAPHAQLGEWFADCAAFRAVCGGARKKKKLKTTPPPPKQQQRQILRKRQAEEQQQQRGARKAKNRDRRVSFAPQEELTMTHEFEAVRRRCRRRFLSCGRAGERDVSRSCRRRAPTDDASR